MAAILFLPRVIYSELTTLETPDKDRIDCPKTQPSRQIPNKYYTRKYGIRLSNICLQNKMVRQQVIFIDCKKENVIYQQLTSLWRVKTMDGYKFCGDAIFALKYDWILNHKSIHNLQMHIKWALWPFSMKMCCLHSIEWIPNDGRSIFMDDIHKWISTLQQFAHARKIGKDNITVLVPFVYVMLQYRDRIGSALQ